MPLYAQAGIPECWIVNLQEGILEVYREPAASRYKSLRYYTPDENISPLFDSSLSIPVASLFARAKKATETRQEMLRFLASLGMTIFVIPSEAKNLFEHYFYGQY